MNRLEQLDMTIEEFCEIHDACEEGRDWAIANCKTMAECWEKLPPEFLVWTATCPGVMSDKEQRMFAAFCCREVWYLLADQRSRNAVEVTERFANGQASKEEMHVAYLAAVDASCAAARTAAYVAAYSTDAAARTAAYAAAYSTDAAARTTAHDAARTTAHEAAHAAAYAATDSSYAAAYAAARQKQADWLRSNIIPPNFKKV